ncbi:MAG: fimbria/pilus periplasmic chaperone [Acidocella sp.]|nr:fimbria/pilus periplasmic chaperone [Acidocella sp.]
MLDKRALLRGALVSGVAFSLPKIARSETGTASLQISPTTLALSPGGVVTANLYNSGDATANAQARLKRWTQDDSGDVLADTDNVVVSPPFASLAPQASQILRIADLSTPASVSETAYRLLVNQLPSAGALSGAHVEILLAFSVPVFIAGSAQTPPSLSYAIVNRGADMLLAVYNAGGTHARLASLRLRAASGAVIMAIPGLAGYALPNAAAIIKIPAAQATAARDADLFLQTQLDSQPQQITRRAG